MIAEIKPAPCVAAVTAHHVAIVAFFTGIDLAMPQLELPATAAAVPMLAVEPPVPTSAPAPNRKTRYHIRDSSAGACSLCWQLRPHPSNSVRLGQR
jgi:hypothetical protein